jgi:predicted MPP superfamily phosphohydrolase
VSPQPLPEAWHSIQAKLPDAFLNYRIAQISDIHFDEFPNPLLCAAWLAR